MTVNKEKKIENTFVKTKLSNIITKSALKRKYGSCSVPKENAVPPDVRSKQKGELLCFLTSSQKRASSSWRVSHWNVASQWIAQTWCWTTASGPRVACSGSGSLSIASSIWAPAPVWDLICSTRRSPSARLHATPLSLCFGGAATGKYCRGLPSGRWLWLDVWWW